ncbi:MAG: hypothetical protein KJO18_00525 [Acidimicrobiia bacterium]|nr:hypothetical protein [Acidimicrobiia bacterium]RZV45924.1 MAG: hypothetical protein EX269_08570 [Acidimicrobiales bacterium]
MSSHRGRGRGRGRRTVEPPALTAEEAQSWFAGSLPDDWFTDSPSVKLDRDEIIVTGRLATPKIGEDDDARIAAHARINSFREETRDVRIGIADRAQQAFLRKVSWAVVCGDETVAFTTASVPVMTRLSMDQRATLDTLIDAGVARSRSDALAWSVQLVADNEAEWIGQLRDAMEGLSEVRDSGPSPSS